MHQIAKKLMPMLLICFIAGSALAILAPYGTHAFPVFYRFVYWVSLTFAGGLGAASIDVFVMLRKKPLHNWLHAFAQSIAATIAVFIVLVVMMQLTYGLPSLASLLLLLFYIGVIAAIITAIGALIRAREAYENLETPTRPALYERLPAHLRSAVIYALAAEDHYVKVITEHGNELVLMRLSDAIKETAPLKGLRPHRSWWVAEAGVAQVEKSEITLRSKQVVPISRTGMKLVRAAGWK